MPGRDRTEEFYKAASSLQAQKQFLTLYSKNSGKPKPASYYSDVFKTAKKVGKDIAATYSKLEKLTLLAQTNGLFHDRPQEIQELSCIIKSDLNTLNYQIAHLQQVFKDQKRAVYGKHLVTHSSNMVLSLQSKLAYISSDFKQVLENRTENIKHQSVRREKFDQSPMELNTFQSNRRKYGTLLLDDDNERTDTRELPIGSSNNLEQSSSHQFQAAPPCHHSSGHMQQRVETMQSIETTVVELGGIFQQLAYMVKEQEEAVDRIGENMHDIENNIESAYTEILHYLRSISRNRWIMLKVFGVLIFLFLFFIVFLT